jgi:hypothetical protein
MTDVMTCSIILHNMIIEDEWGDDECEEYLFEDNFQVSELLHDEGCQSTILEWQQARNEYMNESKHFQLRADLIEHLWQIEHGKSA